MRLPQRENPITSVACPFQPTTGISVCNANSKAGSKVNSTLILPPEQDVDAGATVTTPLGTLLPKFLNTKAVNMKPDGHHPVHPVQHVPIVPVATEPTSGDPLDLVIAKRKRKELADPVIAEAILTASKLPPPLIPETQDTEDVPEEIQQLIRFGLIKQGYEADNVDFFRNYALDQLPQPPQPAVSVPALSRYEQFRRKYLAPAFRSYRYDEESLDEDTLRDTFTSTIHADEDWFMESVLHVVCMLLIIITLPLSLIFCLKVVAHYERAVLFRLGRLISATAQGPGLIFVLPCLDRYRILDLRTFTFDVPTQEVLTKDSVTVVVNAVVYYRVRDPVRAVVNVEDANRATRVLGQTTLRNVLGTVNLDELLTAREDIAALMQECLDSVTEAWGVKVERVEIKDVRLPIQLQRAMAAEAESVREATAKVIAAEGEMRASGALKAAAFEINQHPIAMQLRYLQAMNSISSGKESTIVFPVPLDLFSFFRTHCDNTDLKVLTVADGKKLLEQLRLSLEDLQMRPELQKDLSEDYFSHDQFDASTLIV
ncbi:erythrocyte band 7 integral membrane protein [Paragonimus westermani]|uniref:Erythrocyte band 7 integral membrane protein n=1 Tax=Paragonimus westermani TaxID=34504 RepID=A0A5J4P3H3_9TREM|nr:erythrocyte band 7 integral membrane protein [Paragonimus westermani]